MSVDDKITVASVSKTMTATAVMKLLARNKLTVDTPVWPYLPSTWALGPNVKTITFRELLSHRAGVRCETKTHYAGVRACFEGGVALADKAEQKYNNLNYAAFRIILPRLDGMPVALIRELEACEQRGDAKPIETVLAGRYASIMNAQVFAPAGLPPMFCHYTDAKPALSYKPVDLESPLDFAVVGRGEDWGDASMRCGSAGWFFSARQLATFMHALIHTARILPPEIVAQMKAENLGLWARKHGGLTSYNHGGYHPASMNRGELHTFVGDFSNGLSVGLVINSNFNGKIVKELVDAIREADQAVVAGKG